MKFRIDGHGASWNLRKATRSNIVELKWCLQHQDPVLVYSDGSQCCRWELVTSSTSSECEVVALEDACIKEE